MSQPHNDCHEITCINDELTVSGPCENENAMNYRKRKASTNDVEMSCEALAKICCTSTYQVTSITQNETISEMIKLGQ